MSALNPNSPTLAHLLPLKGQASFVDLLRARPLAHWENIRVYAAHSKLDNAALPQAIQKNKTTLFLGHIVPKKQLPLAVDRNRVRRLARAHVRALTQEQTNIQAIDMLVKINVEKRPKNTPAKTYVKAERNPHSKTFALGLKAAINQAVSALAYQNKAK